MGVAGNMRRRGPIIDPHACRDQMESQRVARLQYAAKHEAFVDVNYV
jgi:hypothetical protein